MTQNYSGSFAYAREKHHFFGDFSRELFRMVARKDFQKRKLRMLLQTAYEIKMNGFGYLLEPLKK